MAQSGYTPILIYASGTTGNTPTAANLTSSSAGAELALNYYDGKLFYKDNTGTVQVLAGKGGTGVVAGSNTQLQFNNNGVFGASSGMTWDGTYFTANSIKDTALTSTQVVYAGTSGLLQSSSNMTFNGTTMTLNTLNLTNQLTVPYGGTGLTSLTANYIPYGNGTGALNSSSSFTFNGTTLSSPQVIATESITGSSTTGAFSYGTLASTSADTNIFASFTSNVNSYTQIILQNTNALGTASTDYVVNNNNSTATTYYGDYGMNSSGWSGVAGTNSFNAPNMVYLTSTTADLLIGTTTANTIRFAVGGGSDAMQINGTTSIVSFPTTGAITLPAGTTAQEPSSPAQGMLRFNTSTSQFEGYNGTAWASVGGAALVNDTTTATAVYPLFAHATSGTALTIYTSNANYLFTPSTGQLQAPEVYASNGIFVNNLTVGTSYTIPTGASAHSVGPVTVATGQSVTVPSGSRWVIL